MRKAKFSNLGAASGDARFCVCACGHEKERAKSLCYECQDMRKLIRHRIPMAGGIEIAERYGRIYEMPLLRHDVDYRSARYEDSENFGSLHNVIRAMEDSLADD